MKIFIILIFCFYSNYVLSNPCKKDNNTINITSTLPFIHSLTLHLIEGVDNINSDLLIEGNISPHDYLLKPTDAKKIINSNIVIMIDTEMETFMNSYNKSNQCQTWINLADNQDLLPPRKSGIWQNTGNGKYKEQHNHDHHHDHDHHEHNEKYDYHIWLSPKKMLISAETIAKALAKEDPRNAVTYFKNLENLQEKLNKKDKEISKTFKDKSFNFIVFHDAYQYFEIDYNLTANGSFTGPINLTSAKKYKEITDFIGENNISCIIYELNDNFKQKKNFKVPVIQIDLLGVNINKDKDFYFNYIDNIANTFSQCIKE